VKQDPLALAFFGAALALLAGLLFYVLVFKSPEPALPPRSARSPGVVEELQRVIAGIAERFRGGSREKSAPTPAVAPPSAPVREQAKRPASGFDGWRASVNPLPAGITWTYRVSVEPPAWRDAVLIYRTVKQGTGVAVDTEFRHAQGNMQFRLGIFEAGHPSHANVRFPGFFMYPAYFRGQLQIGQKVAWEWPWQLPDSGTRPKRIKRYEGVATQIVPGAAPIGANIYSVRVDGTLSYIEDGRVRATVSETLWYASKASQLIKVVREGRSPDEAATRIVAELVDYR